MKKTINVHDEHRLQNLFADFGLVATLTNINEDEDKQIKRAENQKHFQERWKQIDQTMINEGLTSKTVKSATLSLESVDDIHGNDSFSAGMLRVSDGVFDDGFKEDLEDISRLFINQP